MPFPEVEKPNVDIECRRVCAPASWDPRRKSLDDVRRHAEQFGPPHSAASLGLGRPINLASLSREWYCPSCRYGWNEMSRSARISARIFDGEQAVRIDSEPLAVWEDPNAPFNSGAGPWQPLENQ